MSSAAPNSAQPRPWLGGWHLLVPIIALAAVRDLWAPDEPRYAQIAREAYESGSLLVLHLCGDVYPAKPPLVYWLAGAFGQLGGWSGFALRLPLILATAGSAWISGRIARRLLGDTAAAWTVVFYLGTAMIVWFGGRLQLDPLLAFFCLAAVDLAWTDEETTARRGSRLLLAGACTGLAALSKGPVAWLIVGLALAALRLRPAAPNRSARAPVLFWVGFVMLAILPVIGWAIAASIREPALWKPLFVGQHVERAMDGDAPHAGPPWEHLWQMPLLFLPWTPWLVLGSIEAWRAWRAQQPDSRARWLVRMSAWLVAVLVVFSAMPPKRELYLLPIYPAAAWLAAVAFERALAAGRSPWLATWPVSVLFAVLGLAALVAPHVVPSIHEYAWGGAAIAVPLLGAAGASSLALRRGNLGRWADSIALGITGAGLVAALAIIPAVDVRKSPRDLADIVAQRPEKPGRIPCVGVQPEGYRFYGGIPAVRSDTATMLSTLEREGSAFLGLVSESEWNRASEETRARFSIISQRRVGSRAVLLLGQARKSKS